MSLWLVIALTLGLIKLPIAALMLWLPFRDDDAVKAPPPFEPGDEDGGSPYDPALPHGPAPLGARRRRPRRGPHGGDSAPSPPRVRATAPRYARLPPPLSDSPLSDSRR
jgi:hypothetical protein